MRGTAVVLVCLISLHYLSVIDASAAGFTSENGMPGRQHEDQHPRRSDALKRRLSRALDRYNDYETYYDAMTPVMHGYEYKDSITNVDLYDDMDDGWAQRVSPDMQKARSLSASPDDNMRQMYYDNFEQYGGIPNIPIPYYDRDAGIDEDTGAGEDKGSFTKTLKRLVSPVVDAVRELWGKLSGKSLESVGPAETKQENARKELLKKKAMESRKDEFRGVTNPKKRNFSDPIKFLIEMAKKALDFTYNIISKIDVSQFSEETKKLKEAVLGILENAKKALNELLGKVATGPESPSARRTRSVGKRTNARDALESYLTSLKPHKRSKARNSLRRSARGDDDTFGLMDLMTEMEECIRKIPPTNTSHLGVECIVLPLIKFLASPKPGGASELTTGMDSDVISDIAESPDKLRKLHFPWGSIFLIPIYNGQGQGDNSTAPPCHDQGCDNSTTTTTTTTTTAAPAAERPTTTTEAMPDIIYDEPGKEVRSDSKYRSRYDNHY